MPHARERRSAQSRSGITIRTRKGSTTSVDPPETIPQNSQSFGGDNIGAGAGGNFLAAPGVGFRWIITSLIVSWNLGTAQTCRVTFTGNLATVGNVPTSTSPQPNPAQLIQAPFAIAANTAFGYSSSGSGNFSISGTAYKATDTSSFSPPQSSQSESATFGTPIDSDLSADLG